MNNSILIGRVFGIPIKVHSSLILLTVLLSLFSMDGFLSTLFLMIGIFASVALHELGHSIVARRKGSYIHEIVLFPLGGVAKISNIPKKPSDEIQVALAGPAVSLLLAYRIGVGPRGSADVLHHSQRCQDRCRQHGRQWRHVDPFQRG